jgi:hypothetical protein
MNGSDIKQTGIPITLDKERHFIFDLNAMEAIEEKYGSIDEALSAAGKQRMKDMKFLIYEGLLHEDESITLDQVGKMVNMLNLTETSHELLKGMGFSLPDAETKRKNV